MANETANKSADETSFFSEIFKKSRAVGILGSRNSGKTAMCFYISQFTDLNVHIFNYPKRELLPSNWKIVYDFEELIKITDSFIIIDEPQLYIPIYEKTANIKFMKLLSLMRQKDNILVTATSDSRFYTRGLESYIDTWILKDIDFETLKQGSKASKIIKKNSLISPEAFKLDVNEYVLEDRNFKEYCGRHTFNLPAFWKEEMSKAFKII